MCEGGNIRENCAIVVTFIRTFIDRRGHAFSNGKTVIQRSTFDSDWRTYIYIYIRRVFASPVITITRWRRSEETRVRYDVSSCPNPVEGSRRSCARKSSEGWKPNVLIPWIVAIRVTRARLSTSAISIRNENKTTKKTDRKSRNDANGGKKSPTFYKRIDDDDVFGNNPERKRLHA